MTEQQLDRCRDVLALPGLSGEFRAEWGSRSPGYRDALRRGLLADLQKRPALSGIDLAVLKELSRPPVIKDHGASVSHSPLLGGYLISEHTAIGLDIEEKWRLRREIVGRVCSQDEMNSAPQWAFLWSAKEATYKALLGNEQPQVISEIVVLDWKKIEDGVWKYEAARSADLSKTLGVGLIFDSPPHFFAVFRHDR